LRSLQGWAAMLPIPCDFELGVPTRQQRHSRRHEHGSDPSPPVHFLMQKDFRRGETGNRRMECTPPVCPQVFHKAAMGALRNE